ncbi:MAG TPA: class I SAM-dependent rRNA methyltransferase [bacterium]|nr:class I SAM-dependent rRNA methyltransferase [bacterium]HMY36545.1 class I SAM-dependent rRNA methyltransferase [bacterium]HMZ05296.1 class I SAM-dependent rRNA methyltransferase [bacterium]HNB08299.1 class I SAM-dependent rRNA methyltransferase [bacterium]HND78259.1 class I SAM-dependent rRNA methyltransferase [bacterium]
MHRIRLKSGKEKKIRNAYPWIFRDDIATQFKDRGDIPNGAIVEIADAEDKFLAVGYYNALSHIVVRVLDRKNRPIDKNFFKQRIQRAFDFRTQLALPSDARRLIHAEGDRLPGLMVDQFGAYLVVQFRSLGMEKFRTEILETLVEVVKPKGIYDRSDMESREEEGLEPFSGVVYGAIPEEIVISENDLLFHVDIHHGHKTGFYLDQRENRAYVRTLVKPNQTGLDLFSYTGGFAVALAQSGVRMTAVDQDAAALEGGRANARRNNVEKRLQFIHADVFKYMEEQVAVKTSTPDKVKKYDVIIIDPPAIAKRKEGIEKLKWAYWKLLHQAIQLLNPGGHIVLSSCAYHMPVDLMLEAARFASADNGVSMRVVNITYQPPDHPWMLQIPETLYLKTVYFQLM